MTEVNGVLLEPQGDMVVLAARGGEFEPESFRMWRRACLRPGAVVVDVGAYTGLYAIYAKLAGAWAYAFEPNPANYERFMQNMLLNPGPGLLATFNSAVGMDVGRCNMTDLQGRPPLTSAGKVESHPAGAVEMVTLDNFDLPRCDMIKADVEGAELDVLMGAHRTIMAHRPRLLLEANDEAHRAALDVYLSTYGYGPGVRMDERNLFYVHPVMRAK